MKFDFVLFVSIFILLLQIQELESVPKTINMAGIIPNTRSGDPTPGYPTALFYFINQVNNNSTILPNTKLVVQNTPTSNAALSFKAALKAYQNGIELLFCCMQSSATQMVGPVTTIAKMPMLAFTAASDLFSNKYEFPYFSRVNPRSSDEAEGAINIIQYLYEQSNIVQYTEISVICTTDEYGVSGSKKTILLSNELNYRVLTYQQFLQGATDLSIELSEFRSSKGRVFVAVMDNQNFRTVSIQGTDLFGEYYIWICLAACATSVTYYNSTSQSFISDQLYQNEIGMLGASRGGFTNQMYYDFVKEWSSLDPTVYPGAGVIPDPHTCYIRDMVYFYATAIDRYVQMNGFTDEGKLKDHERFLAVLRNTTINGVTGFVQLYENGDRVSFMNLVNLRKGDIEFSPFGTWNESNGRQIFSEIYFYNGTTNIPDINIKPPFKYWDCSAGEMKTDPTGKTIQLSPPDSSNPNDIKSSYYCDSFIDCENFSDESKGGCSTNYLVLFIIFGIVTGLMIVVSIFLIFFTIIFGFIFPKHRVRASSPLFMILLLISCIFGFASIYAWYGKPNHIGCGFQPWLLGLSVTSLVACLCSKTFRIWRIFRFPFDRKVISDLELIIFWVIMMVPALLLLFLWTLISTPTTRMKNLQNNDHLVCDTGGFTGPPGGYVFFGIYVGYTAILAAFGAFLSIVTQKVPSLYNESKLLAISIYNLVFLSIIIIPCVVVLNSINPFVSWIIRSIGIWYAFTATIVLQFAPKLVGVFTDKVLKNHTQTTSGGNTLLSHTDVEVFRGLPEAHSLPGEDD